MQGADRILLDVLICDHDVRLVSCSISGGGRGRGEKGRESGRGREGVKGWERERACAARLVMPWRYTSVSGDHSKSSWLTVDGIQLVRLVQGKIKDLWVLS